MPSTVFVALVTCYDESEQLDLDATRAQVRRQVAAGNGIMAAGTNGDFTALTFDEKVRLIEAVTIDNTRSYWIARLKAAGIPSGPIQSVDQVLRDPQILARNMVVDVLDRNGRPAFKAAGNPIKMSGLTDPTVRRAAPDLDGNRGEILRWLEE